MPDNQQLPLSDANRTGKAVTTSRVLARNAGLTIAAQAAPLAVGLVATPLLINGLGQARFSIIGLAWYAIGYFGVFDLGLGRALTHAIATRIGANDTDDLGVLTWTGLVVMGALGVVGGLIFAAVTPVLVDRALKIPPDLQPEARTAFYVISAAIPATVLTTGLRGILEAFQDFPTAAALRVPLGMLGYLAPVAMLPFSRTLGLAMASLAAVRALGCVLHLAVCLRRYAFLRHDARLNFRLVTTLLRYGGWLTVSNVVSPLMAYLDRFLVAGILPVAVLAYYVAPFEVVSKMFVLPAAVLAVLFPAFASTFAANREQTVTLIDRGLRAILMAIFPAALLLVCLAPEGLELWINPEFARESTRVLQWLAIGVLINSAGQVAFTALQGVGRPDVTAKVNLLELPLYIVAIWVLTHRYGLVGVAAAWTLRMCVDTTALFMFAMRVLPTARPSIARAGRVLIALVVALAVAASFSSLPWRAAALVIGGVGFAIVSWTILLQPRERVGILGWLTRARAEA